MAKLYLDKQECELLDKAINHWVKEGLLNEESSQNLRCSYEIKGFDWRRLAQYSIWIALGCGAISIASLIIDDMVIKWLEKLYETPDIIISIFTALLAALFYYEGQKRKRKYPERVFSNEAIIFFGILFTASSIAYLGKTFDNGSGRFSILFLVSVLVYAILALKLKSKLIWTFALVSLGSWFGTETGYQTNWGDYFLGMNYPLRFVWFGLLLVGASFVMLRMSKLLIFRELTYIIGLLYLFISLWLLSIFGNFGSFEDWIQVKQIDLFYWGIVSLLFAIGFTIYGLKKQDILAREFGITFLLINLYSRYFEYFWDITDKTIFFFFLALSFWLIGRKAEKIWNLQLFKKNSSESPNETG